jgi:hypothetical protein
MRAIRTKYLGPTNNRGSRVKVIDEGYSDRPRTIAVPWDYALNPDENHAAAARVALRRWDWSGRWVGGGLRDGMCFACDPDPKVSKRIRNRNPGTPFEVVY